MRPSPRRLPLASLEEWLLETVPELVEPTTGQPPASDDQWMAEVGLDHASETHLARRRAMEADFLAHQQAMLEVVDIGSASWTGVPATPAVPASPLPGAPSPTPINMGATPGGQTCNVSAASTSPTLPVNIASLPVNMANIPAVAAAAMGLPSAPFTADGAPTGGVAGAVGGAAALQAALINTALSGAGPASDRATATGGGTAGSSASGSSSQQSTSSTPNCISHSSDSWSSNNSTGGGSNAGGGDAARLGPSPPPSNAAVSPPKGETPPTSPRVPHAVFKKLLGYDEKNKNKDGTTGNAWGSGSSKWWSSPMPSPPRLIKSVDATALSVAEQQQQANRVSGLLTAASNLATTQLEALEDGPRPRSHSVPAQRPSYEEDEEGKPLKGNAGKSRSMHDGKAICGSVSPAFSDHSACSTSSSLSTSFDTMHAGSFKSQTTTPGGGVASSVTEETPSPTKLEAQIEEAARRARAGKAAAVQEAAVAAATAKGSTPNVGAGTPQVSPQLHIQHGFQRRTGSGGMPARVASTPAACANLWGRDTRGAGMGQTARGGAAAPRTTSAPASTESSAAAAATVAASAATFSFAAASTPSSIATELPQRTSSLTSTPKADSRRANKPSSAPGSFNKGHGGSSSSRQLTDKERQLIEKGLIEAEPPQRGVGPVVCHSAFSTAACARAAGAPTPPRIRRR